MEASGFLTLCMPIKSPRDSRVHCFKIPPFVDSEHFHKPDPWNYPELSLVSTVLALVEHVEPLVKDKEFTKALTDISNKYIQQVKDGLPAGVELKRNKPLAKAA